MAWHSLMNGTEIKRILDFMIQRGTDIEVHIPGDDETYFSKFLETLPVTEAGLQQTRENGLQLALENLSPRIGNDRVRNSPDVEVYFPFTRFLCRFRSNLVSGTPLHHRVLIGYPGMMEVEEKRNEERFYIGSPDFLSAVFTVEGKNKRARTYDLGVVNYSNHGLGLLVGEEDSCLLSELEPGDTIPMIFLFGEALLVRISAVFRHKSEIRDGPHAGSFVVGLESQDRLNEHLDHLGACH
jgi:hypothetical protein